ncbi:uncharacterized protein LOC141813636 [Curcuma longa]|uniref:uncharacterized protein LOC141813636 n=1 Tax=Curcuma longa TaxID=136217 RepID=UPI003D9E18CA
MEDPSTKSLSENLDVKPSFRKLTSDAAGRKYRRHSPLGRSDSSSSGGSPRYERSRSPLPPKNNLTRVSSDQRRNDAGRESERDSHSARNRPSRGHESQKHSEKYSHSNSHEYKRRDAYSKHDRQIDENDRNYQRSSRYARNERSSDYTRVERLSGRYTEIPEDRIKDKKEREYDKGFEKIDARRKLNQHYDSEQDRYRKRESHDYRSSYRRSPPVCKNDTASSKEHHAKEDHKRKYHEREDEKRERRTLFSPQEKNVEEASINVDKKNQNSPSREVKDGPATHDEVPLSSSEPVGETNSSNKNAEAANAVGSAKFAAMKAAELVNKNLVGFGGVGCLSTDQKKKLLWGNKKDSSQESSSSWDLHLFSDQERQEKFNRLMGVKGNAAPDVKALTEKDGSLQAKKREELDTDLEKQYTAGLRRRDGRTVGLGL